MSSSTCCARQIPVCARVSGRAVDSVSFVGTKIPRLLVGQEWWPPPAMPPPLCGSIRSTSGGITTKGRIIVMSSCS
ncbi:hypothetical protein GCM10022222_29820 [Amycolatopsis ultiminotia]|uniref:Uncharacterized protein n=1 Tax=Amycolatopsis ultiminotia TaxID=543629 RepID=A0ABP6VZZ2_9PSEU